MNPVAMTLVLGVSLAFFAWTARRRWTLLHLGAPDPHRLDHLIERMAAAPGTVPTLGGYAVLYGAIVSAIVAPMVLLISIGGGVEGMVCRVVALALVAQAGGLALLWALRAQMKMPKYPLAGLAHYGIFTGFAVLLLRTIILVGRGYVPGFNFWILDPNAAEPLRYLGVGYNLLKEFVALLVLFGCAVFTRFRLIQKQKRFAYGWHAWVVLGVIATMMLADMVYDGGHLATLAVMQAGAHVNSAGDLLIPMALHDGEPVAGFIARGFLPLAVTHPGFVDAVSIAGFWTHVVLVFAFLNYLPYGKHFHVLVALPNVITRNMDAPGRLPLVAATADGVIEKLSAAMEGPDPNDAAFGIGRMEHFTWKALLDFYTCTECGRCSDNCPAHQTGKLLSPKHLTTDLRDQLYSLQDDVLHRPGGPRGKTTGTAEGETATATPNDPFAVDIVPNIIHPDVLWGCTTCRACEEQCPVMITYVDKIVEMRRNLVMVRGEFPPELQKTFTALETNGNPWNITRLDRAAWSEGLDVPLMADKPDAEVLYWVGCAASYDDRAKKIARATARLLKHAGVDFAVLGSEETCTGDAARRAGNEHLFMVLAEQNVATLNKYKPRTILATCPHCFNTLKNEYPDLGGHYDVVHHTDFLLGLLTEGKLRPVKGVQAKVVFHDSCYLGRYNGVYEPPREILRRIPGVELLEADLNREKGLCCGAGGAQMWMEEQPSKERVNKRRTLQLVDTGADTIASGCPFCQTMLTDGLKDVEDGLKHPVNQLDVAEVLERSVIV